MKKPELLAPAGNLNSAIYAFKAGADGIYFGLTSFSARKFAPNFDFMDYRRLLNLTKKENKRCYLALNTIILEDEIDNFIHTLQFLSYYPPSGIIIQDIGLIPLIKYFLPDLNLHLSTQGGTYSGFTFDILHKLGIKRVILAREITIDDLSLIKSEALEKDIEIEMFIHGALCYSFSGFCLASGLLLSRSGNRGECAQICRNLYKLDPISVSKISKNYPDNILKNFGDNGVYTSLFSCNDICYSDFIKQFIELEIDAFKIEGRMKNSEYVYNTVRLYRDLIDVALENSGDRITEQINYKKDKENLIKNQHKKSIVSFSRQFTSGYLFDKNSDKLTNPFFPAHTGIVCGKIMMIKKDGIFVDLNENIFIRDGIQIIASINHKVFNYQGSIKNIVKNNQKCKSAKKGELAFLQTDISSKILEDYPELENLDFDNVEKRTINLRSNTELKKEISIETKEWLNNFIKFFGSKDHLIDFLAFNSQKKVALLIQKISDRTLDLPLINPASLNPIFHPIDIHIKLIDFDMEILNSNNQSFNIEIELKMELFMNFFKESFKFPAFLKKGDDSFYDIFIEQLSLKKNYQFKYNFIFDENTMELFNKIFVIPSDKKKLFHKIQLWIDNCIEASKSEKFIEKTKKDVLYKTESSKVIDKKNYDKDKRILTLLEKYNVLSFEQNIKDKTDNSTGSLKRDELSLKKEIDHHRIPFAHLNCFDDIQNFASFEELVIIPLHPIIFEEKKYVEALEKLIEKYSDKIFLLGLNATWHLQVFRKLSRGENISGFLDFYIYQANRFSNYFYSNFEKILFGFYWIEYQEKVAESLNSKDLNLPLLKIKDFIPPLFLSRGCIPKNLIFNGSCPENCIKQYIIKLSNQKRIFTYIDFDCISYLFLEDKN
jgi:putative protease